MLVKTKTAVAALTVMAVETLASVVVVLADSNCNGGQNRVSGGSSGNSGYGSGRQQQ
jgi:hypothetical protein